MADEPDPKDSDKEPDPKSEPKEPDHKAEADKWKAMARKHEAEAKKNVDAVKKLAELEEKDKSELQKLTDRTTVAESKAAEAELRALRYEVAHEKGLTAMQAKRLMGSTKEELEADADELLEAFKSDKDDEAAKKPPNQQPKPKLKGGTDPESEDAFDIEAVLKKIPR